jgi:hypothetical protein
VNLKDEILKIETLLYCSGFIQYFWFTLIGSGVEWSRDQA